jgi:outer membrane biosynthesis protein TonB
MPGLPPALDRIVRKAMAKEPTERYASALDMANDLTNVRSKLSGPSYPASVSLSASVASAIEQSRKTSEIQKRKIAYIGAGALAAAAVVAIAWSQMRPGSANLEAAGAPAPVVAQPSPQAVPTGSASTGVAAATPTIQAPPTPQPPARQERTSTPKRDERVTPPKPSPKPVQTRVAATQAPPITVPSQTATARQDPPPPAAPVVIAPAPVVSPPKQETTPAPAPPTAGDVAPTVQAYARAIESRDIGALRRVYPGLSSDQQRNFEQFFRNTRSINVTLRVANVEGSRAAADARLDGSYEFVTLEGRTERQAVSWAVTFRHDGNSWRLASVR